MTRLQDIREAAWGQRDGLLVKYPSWDREMDARVAAFNRLGAILTGVHASFFWLAEFLRNEQKGHSTLPLAKDAREYYFTTFIDFTRTGLLISTFSTVESSFRSFLRAIDPNACNGATSEFKSVYECLLRSKLSVGVNDYIQLLDLLRHARNTIHNNGVYLSKTGTDVQVPYKGVTYRFPHGTRIDFVTFEFVLSLTEDLAQLLFKIVADPALTTITATIKDLSSELQ